MPRIDFVILTENSYSKRKDEGSVGGEVEERTGVCWVDVSNTPPGSPPTPPEMGPASAQLLEHRNCPHICSSLISLLKGVSEI